jgi:hypothetical protein
MDNFTQQLQAWQIFYATVATSAVTLTGLLFVSLTLDRERLKGNQGRVLLATARRTFGDFLYVLMIALTFLVPHQVPFSLFVALLVLGLSRGIGLILEAARMRKAQGRNIDSQAIIREIGLPSLASLGLVIVAFAVAFGKMDALYGLVGVMAALLVTASWNAWLLLVKE